MNLTQLFDLSFQRRASEVAREFAGHTFAFGEIDDRSDRMAALFRARTGKGYEPMNSRVRNSLFDRKRLILILHEQPLSIAALLPTDTPCFALGMIEAGKRQCGFLALRPTMLLPQEISRAALGRN